MPHLISALILYIFRRSGHYFLFPLLPLASEPGHSHPSPPQPPLCIFEMPISEGNRSSLKYIYA